MGFFDKPETQQLFENIGNISLYDNCTINYPVGSMVLISKSSNTFHLFKPDTEMDTVNPDYSSIGIVLNQIDNNTYAVMYKGFLNQEKLPLMSNMNIRSLASKDNRHNYIASIILNDFNRYKNIYYNTCKYAVLKNTELQLPTNVHMDIIVHNTALIIENLSKLIGDDKTESFYNKLISERIYCNIGGRVAEWKIPTEKKPVFYSEPSIIGGYFLPIMIIKLFK